MSPGSSAFRSRSSTGSIPSSAASRSICASAAKHVCTAPKPRIAPHGGLFVYTAVASISALSTRYGPSANDAAFEATAVELEAYAPPSSRISHPDAREPPLARRAVLAPDPRRVPVDVARERLGAVVDHLHRTARVQREQRAVDLHREVLAPAERAADAGEVHPHLLRAQGEARRHLVAVDVEPLGRDVDVDAALAVRHREARLGAEEGLILDPDLVRPGHDDVSRRVRDRRGGSRCAGRRSGRGSSR